MLIDPNESWRPEQQTAQRPTYRLQPGQVVVIQRKPYRVDEVLDLPADQWPQTYVALWLDHGMPDTTTWTNRPMAVVGRFEGLTADPRPHDAVATAEYRWHVLPEHYSVCHRCLEIPPCGDIHTDRVLAHRVERLTQDLAILPGACHACREPISRRQKSFTFPAANLLRPDLGDGSAIFHTRPACREALLEYDAKWAAAEPGRTRFFSCPGTRVVHTDGTLECDKPDCLGKGPMAGVVDHQLFVHHHRGLSERDFLGPIAPAALDTALAAARGCWCLAGA